MTLSILLIALSFILAGAVKGLFGMGLPTVSMGLLGLIMLPVQAATLLVIPTLLTNVWQLATGPAFRQLLARFASMMVTTCIGTVIGISFLTSTSPLVSLTLGGVLAIYGVFGLLSIHWKVAPESERWLTPTMGFATGILNGATGVSVMPLVPYLNSLGLSRDALIQSMGLMFTVNSLALGACLFVTNHLQFESLGASALSLLPVFAGMALGTAIRKRMHAELFRKWFFVGLLVLGVSMLTRAMWLAR